MIRAVGAALSLLALPFQVAAAGPKPNRSMTWWTRLPSDCRPPTRSRPSNGCAAARSTIPHGCSRCWLQCPPMRNLPGCRATTSRRSSPIRSTPPKPSNTAGSPGGSWTRRPPPSAPDLSASRAQIDGLNHRMVSQIAEQWPVLHSPDCQGSLDSAKSAVGDNRQFDPLYRQALDAATRSYCSG